MKGGCENPTGPIMGRQIPYEDRERVTCIHRTALGTKESLCKELFILESVLYITETVSVIVRIILKLSFDLI